MEKTTRERLNLIKDNLQEIVFQNETLQGIYTSRFAELTGNKNPKSVASQLSSTTIKKYFDYKTKSKLDDDDKNGTFIYLKGKDNNERQETLNTLIKDLQQEETKQLKD